jgi:basic membrane protein A
MPHDRKQAHALSMFPRRRASLLLSALALLLTLAVIGCGSGDDSSSSSTDSTAAPAGRKIKVGLVTDVGGLNDRSYNALANKGLEDAEARLGVDGRVLISKTNSDYVPNLATLAQQHYDLIIGVGFLMADAVDTVAQKFPDTNFAMIDVDQTFMRGKPRNVLGLLFKSEQGGYLAGYLAGDYAKDHGIDTISSVGGQKLPQVDTWLAGYAAGAKAADPSITVLNDYSQTFVDQSKCKEIALDQISRGSRIVFHAAGECGLGALDAAKSEGVLGIGVDADQRYLGAHILTSAIKKVDVSVFNAARDVQKGTFRGGGNETFDLASDGTGLGSVKSDASKYLPQVNEVAARIKSGEITVPTTVK